MSQPGLAFNLCRVASACTFLETDNHPTKQVSPFGRTWLTPTHILFLHLLTHTLVPKHQACITSRSAECIRRPRLTLFLVTSPAFLSCLSTSIDMSQIWLIFPTHPRHQSLLLLLPQQQQEQEQCWWWNRRVFWPGEEGTGVRSRRVEHSVPAGDKGEACQGPHSSELTHTVMHVTHTHIVIIISLLSLRFLLRSSSCFHCPPLFPLCHILLFDFHSFFVLCASCFFFFFFCVLAYFLCHSTLCDCTVSMGRIEPI